MTRMLQTYQRMLPQSVALEEQGADTSRGGDETGLFIMLLVNMGEGRRPQGRVTGPVRAVYEER